MVSRTRQARHFEQTGSEQDILPGPTPQLAATALNDDPYDPTSSSHRLSTRISAIAFCSAAVWVRSPSFPNVTPSIHTTASPRGWKNALL